MLFSIKIMDQFVRIISGKYKGYIGKIVYEYKHFKGYYLVRIVKSPKKTIYEWNPSQEIVVTENSIERINPKELSFINENIK